MPRQHLYKQYTAIFLIIRIEDDKIINEITISDSHIYRVFGEKDKMIKMNKRTLTARMIRAGIVAK